ncbi:NADPH:quinone reductase-like Zn-dependent oxidoreductase [Paenibacillus phyllosphaerae]|uniref:NADPH:quinone reductase-like Zn-dependent oxidoreductase n=1 Tax=Paenibacillus phyllosphaerae TaxID=274593 RepID=A0A7W5B3T2_9BACL|nr:NAD(P)-dependent alcohol dehydrogenase [Paenibacillus phyllosphaerae]MBB3113898.1 NADPH:quinone reductase-like Zn-dependent oxidoreductase [Paenibacillus phyllosphaerae]
MSRNIEEASELGTGQRTMKAMVYDRYGTTEELRLEEVEVPSPGEDELLIAVHAASVNSWDWDLLRGKPYITRLGGFRKPRYRILGADIAGTVVAVGAAVKRFRPGDEVFGDLSGCNWGGFAEYVCAREAALTLKPAGISFEQAAAIPQAAVLALQGLRNKGRLKKGDKVLINGAGGGVGTFGIQYCKWIGAEVTGVDSGAKWETMFAIGADHVLNYEQDDFTKQGIRYDLILDVVGNHSVRSIQRALKPGGIYVMVGGPMPRLLQTLVVSPLSARFHKKQLTILVHRPNHDDQLVWKELVEKAQVTPVVDRCFPLSEADQALRYLGEGAAKGKVVVRIKN